MKRLKKNNSNNIYRLLTWPNISHYSGMWEKIRETIYIQIASYRDSELIHTIQSCLSHAQDPSRLHFCIAWQVHPEQDKQHIQDFKSEFGSDNRFDIIQLDSRNSRGACWARRIIQDKYDGKDDYTLHLDSHHRFRQNWDTILIDMLKSLKFEYGYCKPVITAYLAPYDPKSDYETNHTFGEHPLVIAFDKFASTEKGVILTKPLYLPQDQKIDRPYPARFFSAHFAFADSSFIKDVSHDPELYFIGEEFDLMIRGYCMGYDFFHPHVQVAKHEYSRLHRPKHWDDHETWWKDDKLSKQKLSEYVDSKVWGNYDGGSRRSMNDYINYSGIDIYNQVCNISDMDFFCH